MKSLKQSNKKAAFTIVELLVVMSIIMILMGILLPAFNRAKRYARRVRQTAQFKSIDVGLELYRNEFEGYPASDEVDPTGADYCGAMRLAEAMMGQDLLGFHRDSVFRRDGTNFALTPPYDNLYPRPAPAPPHPSWYIENLRKRKGPYVTVGNANPYKMVELWGAGNFAFFEVAGDPNGPLVLCDEYKRTINRVTGKRIGMPILYYMADTSRLKHQFESVDNNFDNIYDSDDNQKLVDLPLPWAPVCNNAIAVAGTTPDDDPADPAIFYSARMTKNKSITATDRPYKADSYILISAGYDGFYGSDDDVFNFQKRK